MAQKTSALYFGQNPKGKQNVNNATPIREDMAKSQFED